MEADLGQPDCADYILNKAEESMGKPSILVNNAAYSVPDSFETLDAAGLDAHYKVNVRGAVLLSVEFARRFSGESGGRIIYLTSGQDLGPMPCELAYAASKGAICAFMRSLAKEVGSKGITVNAVDPGPTNTGWMSEELQAALISGYRRETWKPRRCRPSDRVLSQFCRGMDQRPGHPFSRNLTVVAFQPGLPEVSGSALPWGLEFAELDHEGENVRDRQRRACTSPEKGIESGILALFRKFAKFLLKTR